MVSGVNPGNVVIVDKVPTTVEANKVYLVMQNNGIGDKQWTKEDSNTNGNYSDDFYYYLGVLEANNPSKNSSANLLEKVVLGKDLQGEDFLKNEFSVTIYHESVLAINQPESITVDVVKDSFDAAAQS